MFRIKRREKRRQRRKEFGGLPESPALAGSGQVPLKKVEKEEKKEIIVS